MERDAGRQHGDNGGYVENEVAGVGILAQLAVDPRAQLRIRHLDLVGGHGPRTHRAKRVERLADVPLLQAALDVARGNVVADRGAPDGPHGPGLWSRAATSADDD